MDSVVIHRPRNLDWKRAAALLYGDWGTSKAYVVGMAFAAPVAAGVLGYSSLPIILAVCVLTALVAYNYVIVCKYFPDGGGVYSAARDQSRLLAVVGALLLVANMTVTAALSGWASLSYFGIPRPHIATGTMLLVAFIGILNIFGPKHSGSFAVALAAPAVVVVLTIIAMSLPHLTFANLEPSKQGFVGTWIPFVGVILALSGVEAIANLTGVMKLDPQASSDRPSVLHTARKAIWVVALEVVLGTALLGWAMLSLSKDLAPQLMKHEEDMLRFLGEQYGSLTLGAAFGEFFGIFVGIVFGLLLISAVNTAIVALIGLFYMMARDGEMPPIFTRLNRQGVPRFPLFLAILLPVLVLAFVRYSTPLTPEAQDGAFKTLASLYAIGVVGAIAVNVGSCSFNPKLLFGWFERGIMGVTFFILLAVWLTIAKTKPDAFFFAFCVVGFGLVLRAYAQKRSGLQTVVVSREVAAAISPTIPANLKPNLETGKRILVAARGLTPILRFALEEARLRQGALYVLYIKELAVAIPGVLTEARQPRWQDDPQAAVIMYGAFELAKSHEVQVVPIYAVSESAAATILDLSATLGVDFLVLGASRRRFMTQLLKGDVISEVARNLPENIQLIIHG